MKTIKFITFLSCFFACVACQSNEENREINEPLQGTKWKLTGFVDTQTGTVKEPEPNSANCYWLYFNIDKTLNGTSSTNEIMGNYEIANSTIQIINLGGTEINELFDGKLFMESLRSIESFSISGKELKLYHNNKKNYLQFKLN
jgi:heat shock protein HslJ